MSAPFSSTATAVRAVLLAVVLGGVCGGLGDGMTAVAQTPTRAEAMRGGEVRDSSDAPLIRRVRIRGNRYFSDGTLKQRIRTAPNRRILGIPGFTWWRWVYQLGDASWMWNRLGRALKAGGEPPARLDSIALRDDVERLRLFYEQRGFRDATVSARVASTPQPGRVTVEFRIRPGTPTHIRRVSYDGLDRLRPVQKQRLVRGSVLEVDRVDPDDPLTFTAQDQRYEEPVLLEERRRLLTFLRNEGYAAVSRDSIRAIIFRPSPDSFDVTLRVRPGRRYRFGDVAVQVTGPEDRADPRTDTLAVRADTSGGQRPTVVTRIQNDQRLGTNVLRRSLQFTPGDVYDRSEVLATKRRLEGTGIFSFTNITSDPLAADTVQVAADSAVTTASDTTASDTAGTDLYLPLRIEARTRPRHRIRAETFALQRAVVSTAEETQSQFDFSELGVGVALSYENLNAFGGAETFSVRTSGSVGTRLGSDSGADLDISSPFSSVQFEASTSLTLPYLIRPFDRFERLFDLTNSRTRLSLSFLRARRNDLRLRIQGRGDARLRLEMDHSPSLSSLVDVMEVSLSNPDTLRNFQERFLDRIFGPDGGGIGDPVQQTQIIEDYTQPQVNTAFRYTLRSVTANVLRRKRGHIYEASAEVGNTLATLLDRFVFTPSTLEYRLPDFSSDDTGRDGLLYRPYVRLVTDLRRYHPLGMGTTVAGKVVAGWAHPTAGPNLVPLDRRFFSGGASSVRGWRLRELGPGNAALGLRATDDSTTVRNINANILGGDVKLEAGLELRKRMFRNVLGADWVAAGFLDAGNVWFGPRNPGLGSADTTTVDPRALARLGGDRDGRFRVSDFLGEVGVGGGLGLRLEWEYLIVRLDLAWKLHDPAPFPQDVFSGNDADPLLHFGIGHAF